MAAFAAVLTQLQGTVNELKEAKVAGKTKIEALRPGSRRWRKPTSQVMPTEILFRLGSSRWRKLIRFFEATLGSLKEK